MKIAIVGATGTVGKQVCNALADSGHELIKVGRKSGDLQVEMEDPKSIANLCKQLGRIDALAIASGEVAFAPLPDLKREQWEMSVRSKLLGQIELVQQVSSIMNEGGSFTLVSGILAEEHIRAGAVPSTINSAIEGFVKAAALELPKRLRINAVSPALLQESWETFAAYFPGFTPVAGEKVGQAYKRSIMGIETGKVFRVF